MGFQNDYVKLGVGLVLALAVIIYLNPPHTACSAQTGVYQEAIKAQLKLFNKTFKQCRDLSDPGSCLGFFEQVQKIFFRLDELGAQCQAELKSDTRTKDLLVSSMELLAKTAWGSTPPKSYNYRYGWLDRSQAAMFCRLREYLQTIYSEQDWLNFVNRMLTEFPKATEVGRTEAWNRSLISEPCRFKQ